MRIQIIAHSRFGALRDLRLAVEEEQVIVVSEEARLTIVPALDDVHGNTSNS